MSSPGVVPPEGGWGWVVVFATFTYQAIASGMFSTISVLYITWQDEFDEGKSLTSWIISVTSTMTYFTSPIAASLSVKYGYRPVVFFGGFLMGLGVFISYFANSVTFLILSFGLIAGFGDGLCYVTTIAVCAMYFNKKRSLAVGLGVCGSGMGTFLLPRLIAWLEDEFTWRGVLLINSGVIFNVCVLALLLRPLTTSRTELYDHDDTIWDKKGDVMDEKIKLITQDDCRESDVVVEEVEKKSDKEDLANAVVVYIPENAAKIHSDLNLTIGNAAELKDRLMMEPSNNDMKLNTDSKVTNRHKADFSGEGEMEGLHSFIPNVSTSVDKVHSKIDHSLFANDPMINKRPPFSLHVPKDLLTNHEAKSLTNLSLIFGSVHSFMASDLISMTSINSLDNKKTGTKKDSPNNKDQVVPENMSCCDRLGSTLKVYKDLLRNWKCVIIILLCSLVSLTSTTPVLYLADRAVENGIEKQLAVLSLSLYGAGDTFGRLFTGLIADLPWVNRIMLYFLCILLSGVLTALSVFCGPHLALHIAYGFTYGIFIGGWVTLTPVVLVDILGVEVVAQSLGLCFLCRGISNLVGAPIAGWLFTLTGSFTIPFLSYGSLLILSSLLLAPLIFQSLRRDNKEREDEK